MYPDTFLTVCPVCKTVQANLQINLNKKIPCTGCLSRFTAQENYIDVEETSVSHLTPVQADEEQCNDQKRLTSPINSQQEVKEVLEKILSHKQHSLEVDAKMVFSKAPSEIALTNQIREETFESKGRKTECTDRPEDGKEHLNEVTHTNKIATQVSMKEMGFCSEEQKGPQGDSKERKRKYNRNSATWGVALRKPSREKKKIRAYSPSRERTFRKRTKLGPNKGGKCDRTVVKKYKSKERKVCKQNSGASKENSISAANGDVNKCKTTPDVTTDKLMISDPEGYSDEFKQFLKEEIKRQILHGLGEACKSAEIEAVEVEEIHRNTANSLHELNDSMPEEQQYIAKTKLMVTLLFPVTLRAGQGPPQDCHKPMEDYAQPKERESTGLMEGIKEPESTGLMEDIKEPESMGLRKDIKESESGGMEPEKFNDEPLFENEEVDVPESEFYDFDVDRSEDKFSPGQIWASYDSGADVMPRDYLQIKKVMSIKPFKLQITLLEPRGFPEWVKAGNSLTCGEFSIENRLRVMDQIDGFSHIMKWEKGPNDLICIYPAEKDVWALYKDWKELDPNRRIKLGYEIVQIVAINKDAFTVSVVPLVNYKGYRTVFRQQEVEPFKVHKRDFVRFSHQIATYEILDLGGCVELDPAATPY